MKRIILHWTGGRYYPNIIDRQHYHFMIDGDGEVYTGKFTPEDNLNCYDGAYAKHTGGGNTGSIGIALCGMYEYRKPSVVGNYPLTHIQFERAYKLCADLCKKYALTISPVTVMTHYEFGKNNPKTESAGKPDISYIPYEPNIAPDKVGDFIRSKVQWYFERI